MFGGHLRQTHAKKSKNMARSLIAYAETFGGLFGQAGMQEEAVFNCKSWSTAIGPTSPDQPSKFKTTNHLPPKPVPAILCWVSPFGRYLLSGGPSIQECFTLAALAPLFPALSATQAPTRSTGLYETRGLWGEMIWDWSTFFQRVWRTFQ